MLQMIWEFVADASLPNGGISYARKPRNRDGSPRLPDGVKWLSLEQMQEKTGRSRDALMRDYRSTFDELFGDEAAAMVDEATPPADPQKTTSGDAPAAILSASNPLTHVPPFQLARLDLVRVMDYPGWSDLEWEVLVAKSQEKRLSLLSRQVIGRLEPDPITKKMKVVLITTIDALRLLSDRTGRDGGMDKPIWTFDPATGELLTAEQTVYKLAADGITRLPVTCLVHAEEFKDIGLSEYEGRSPKHRLAKIGEAQCRRAAHPQELGQLYLQEEFPGGRKPNTPNRFEPSVDTRPGVRDGFDPPSPDEFPTIASHGHGGPTRSGGASDRVGMNFHEFEKRLDELGYGAGRRRRDMMSEMRLKYRAICDTKANLFYEAVVRDLEQEMAQV